MIALHNSEVRNILEDILGPICALGGTPTETNKLTIHHLDPKREQFVCYLIQLVLICEFQHRMFNIVEQRKPKIANDINDGMKYYRRTKDGLIIPQLKIELETQIQSLGYDISTVGIPRLIKHK